MPISVDNTEIEELEYESISCNSHKEHFHLFKFDYTAVENIEGFKALEPSHQQVLIDMVESSILKVLAKLVVPFPQKHPKTLLVVSKHLQRIFSLPDDFKISLPNPFFVSDLHLFETKRDKDPKEEFVSLMS